MTQCVSPRFTERTSHQRGQAMCAAQTFAPSAQRAAPPAYALYERSEEGGGKGAARQQRHRVLDERAQKARAHIGPGGSGLRMRRAAAAVVRQRRTAVTAADAAVAGRRLRVARPPPAESGELVAAELAAVTPVSLTQPISSDTQRALPRPPARAPPPAPPPPAQGAGRTSPARLPQRAASYPPRERQLCRQCD